MELNNFKPVIVDGQRTRRIHPDRTVVSFQQRCLNLWRAIYTFGSYYRKQNLDFTAALLNEDFAAAKKAILQGARHYLPEEMTENLLKQNKVASVRFLMIQAQFSGELDAGGKTILKLVSKIDLQNSQKPENQLLLKLFLERRPLVKFDSNYAQGFHDEYPKFFGDADKRPWIEVRDQQTYPAHNIDACYANYETFLKCRLLEHLWLKNAEETQPFFDTGFQPSSTKGMENFNYFSPWIHPSRQSFASAIKMGLKHGLDPNLSKDTSASKNPPAPETLLARAIEESEEAALHLLRAGANPNQYSYRARYESYYGHWYIHEGVPLELALAKHPPTLVKELLSHGAIPTKRALIAAFGQFYQTTPESRNERIKQLFFSPLLPTDSLDSDILDLAVRQGPREVVEFILNKGILPNANTLNCLAKPTSLELTTELIKKFPFLANEALLKEAIAQHHSLLISLLLKQNPSLKLTEVGRQLHQDLQNSIVQNASLLALVKE